MFAKTSSPFRIGRDRQLQILPQTPQIQTMESLRLSKLPRPIPYGQMLWFNSALNAEIVDNQSLNATRIGRNEPKRDVYTTAAPNGLVMFHTASGNLRFRVFASVLIPA